MIINRKRKNKVRGHELNSQRKDFQVISQRKSSHASEEMKVREKKKREHILGAV